MEICQNRLILGGKFCLNRPFQSEFEAILTLIARQAVLRCKMETCDD